MPLSSVLRLDSAPNDGLIFALLAAPHLLYAHAWLFSKAWRGAFGANAVRVLEVLAAAGKGKKGERQTDGFAGSAPRAHGPRAHLDTTPLV